MGSHYSVLLATSMKHDSMNYKNTLKSRLEATRERRMQCLMFGNFRSGCQSCYTNSYVWETFFPKVSILHQSEWKAQSFSGFTGQTSSTKLHWWGLKNQKSLVMGHRATFSFSLSSSREFFASLEVLQPSIPALGLFRFACVCVLFQCNLYWVCDSELMRLQCSGGSWCVLVTLLMSSGSSF